MNHKSTFKIIIEQNKRKTKLTNFTGKPCCSFDFGLQRSIHPASTSWSKPQQQQNSYSSSGHRFPLDQKERIDTAQQHMQVTGYNFSLAFLLILFSTPNWVSSSSSLLSMSSSHRQQTHQTSLKSSKDTRPHSYLEFDSGPEKEKFDKMNEKGGSYLGFNYHSCYSYSTTVDKRKQDSVKTSDILIV